jgi:type 1 glutamine amidotransferase
MAPIRTAVVTGRHPFDARGFAELFRSLDGIDAYIQHMEEFTADPGRLRDWYDVVVFYNMHRETPTGKGPWYEKSTKAALERLGESDQGMLMLHHAILAFPEWPMWSEIVGIEDRRFGFHIGESIHVEVAKPDHPITKGLTAWDTVDETYEMNDAGPGSEVLLTTEHPKSMKTLAWTRQYRNAAVLCLQPGHDDAGWRSQSFRTVLERGIHWLAGRLPAAD